MSCQICSSPEEVTIPTRPNLHICQACFDELELGAIVAKVDAQDPIGAVFAEMMGPTNGNAIVVDEIVRSDNATRLRIWAALTPYEQSLMMLYLADAAAATREPA